MKFLHIMSRNYVLMLLGEKIERSMKICPEITDRHRKLYVRPLFGGLKAEPYK